MGACVPACPCTCARVPLHTGMLTGVLTGKRTQQQQRPCTQRQAYPYPWSHPCSHQEDLHPWHRAGSEPPSTAPDLIQAITKVPRPQSHCRAVLPPGGHLRKQL